MCHITIHTYHIKNPKLNNGINTCTSTLLNMLLSENFDDEECFSMEPEALKPGFLLLNEIFPFGMCVFVN